MPDFLSHKERVMRKGIVVSALVALVTFPASSWAQFARLKSGLTSLGEKTGVVKVIDDEAAESGSPEAVASSIPAKLRDGETAVIQTALSVEEATRVVKDYFDNTLNVEYGTRETGWITTERYKVRFDRGLKNMMRGPHDVNNIASARVTSQNGATRVEIRVSEQRQRSEPELKGEPTVELARKLEAVLGGQRATPVGLPTAPTGLKVTPTPASAPVATTAPKVIALGQTPEEVKLALGEPTTIIDLGQKKTLIYPNMKIVFMDGKVADVQ